MNKFEFKTNIEQALNSVDSGVSTDDLNFIADMLYDEKNTWYFNDFYDFAREVRKEDDDIIYALRQYDAIPELLDYDIQVRDWFAEHKQAIKDVLKYASMDEKDLHNILFIDIEIMVEWLQDHKQAYRDCLIYVKNRIKK